MAFPVTSTSSINIGPEAAEQSFEPSLAPKKPSYLRSCVATTLFTGTGATFGYVGSKLIWDGVSSFLSNGVDLSLAGKLTADLDLDVGGELFGIDIDIDSLLKPISILIDFSGQLMLDNKESIPWKVAIVPTLALAAAVGYCGFLAENHQTSIELQAKSLEIQVKTLDVQTAILSQLPTDS